jgi:large subunit ribosomal protein L29
MRAKELRERNDEELKNLLIEAKNSLFKDRIKNATHQLTNSSLLKKNRREVARIQTLLKEREISAAKQE